MFLKALSEKLSRKQHPSFVKNLAYFKDLDQGQPLEQYEFVVFDTELTGLNPKKDEIVSIGAVRIKNLRIMVGETFQAFLKPQNHLPKNSTLIHRITPQQLESAPTLEKTLPRFVEFCGKAFLVGHYVGLDTSFVNRAAKRIFGAALHNPCLDTLRLAQAYKEMTWESYHDRFDMNVSYNLSDLGKEYGLPAFGKHDALEDAMQTAYLFLYLVKKMRNQGIVTLKDLFNAGQNWRWIL
ncbi:3'-5' exonuclease [Thiovibrio sp. JS02]